MSRFSLLSAVALVALVLLAACGSSKSPFTRSSDTTVPSGAPSGAAPSGAAPTAIGPIPAGDRSPAGTFGQKPSVKVPSSAPPSQLESADLITGSGPAAKAGDQVTVQYVGYAYSSKAQFDASWDRGQTFPFQLGGGQVIPGWDQGVVGMKVGGRRELIIPPALAYGAQSPGAGIAPNDTLVFVVDMVKIG